jgi:hypothetical protein
MEYFIEHRLRESTKTRLSANIKKGREGNQWYFTSTALPDLLCDVLDLSNRIGLDDLQNISFEKGIAQSGEVRAGSRV